MTPYYQEVQQPLYCYQLKDGILYDYRHFIQLQRILSILPVQQNRAFVFTHSKHGILKQII
ncbi:hypothetical protein pb186bvf_008007 [Paramecium bursaria]